MQKMLFSFHGIGGPTGYTPGKDGRLEWICPLSASYFRIPPSPCRVAVVALASRRLFPCRWQMARKKSVQSRVQSSSKSSSSLHLRHTNIEFQDPYRMFSVKHLKVARYSSWSVTKVASDRSLTLAFPLVPNFRPSLFLGLCPANIYRANGQMAHDISIYAHMLWQTATRDTHGCIMKVLST